ncbi:winged helix-turn-helix domain-containing protein, partial [Serratia marcescens]|uniref:winged helix-turn-helix domain-containing protein n=1 Tax=Serratia marcescens TaxID=615 RepID=UPI0016531A9E
MKYIIDEKVIFRTDDGAIWPSGDEESKVILSPIVSRLLALLLEEKGIIMTRDDIMHRVWTAHGLEASGNSLNQYISQLRKIMSNFGLGDSVIHTLPRIGFRLDEHLNVQWLPSSTEVQPKPVDEIKIKTNRKHHPIIFLLTPAFLLISITVPYIISEAI